MPIAAVCAQQLVDQRSHHEPANAGAAQHQTDRSAAISYKPARRRGAAGNNVAEADTDSVDDAEAEKKFPRFRGSECQKQRTGTDERRADQVRRAYAEANDRNGHERGGNADEQVEQSGSETEQAAAHGDVLQHVGIDNRADVKRKSKVKEIHRGKRADQLPAVERACVRHSEPPWERSARARRRAAVLCRSRRPNRREAMVNVRTF